MPKRFFQSIEDLREFKVGVGPIIVVDDDQSQLEIFKVCYGESHKMNELICFDNAEALLAYLDDVQVDKKPMPSLVILDINMPGISGFEALDKTRKHSMFSEIPAIFIFSTSADESDIESSQKLGANGFFTKPLDANEYIEFFKAI